MSHSQLVANRLNRTCFCIGTDLDAMRNTVEGELRRRGIKFSLAQDHAHLFSELPVFIAREHEQRMGDLVRAIEAVIAEPAYQHEVLRDAPAIAQPSTRVLPVFMGYDFHIGADGPQLIEINTNAGGGLLNAKSLGLIKSNDPEMSDCLRSPIAAPDVERAFVAMFADQFRELHGARPIRRLVIVDRDPPSQYLYPEFLLFQSLFESQGIETLIADPAELSWRDDELRIGERPIDIVYNRLTDFYFEEATNQALRAAYVSGQVLITPHPRAHALFANKRNLALLTDRERLALLGIDQPLIDLLHIGIPETRLVNKEQAEFWWSQRGQYFFKPACGYGSKASYRGDKITKRVFQQILAGDYVAQHVVPPSVRSGDHHETALELKLDLRCYAFRGEVQLIAARLYQGQTTNFRTPRGGFAPVFIPPTTPTAASANSCSC